MYNHQLENRGFTLIELLVVIAIIGILASVVLAALSSARGKGEDARIQSELDSMRAQSELYTGTGTAWAATGSGANLNCPVPSSATGTIFDTAAGGLGVILADFPIANTRCAASVINANGGGWAVAVETSVGAWCVDSTGASRDTNITTGVPYTTTLTSAITSGKTTCN